VESRGFEANGSDEGVEIVDDALVEAIELRSPLELEPGIRFEGAEKACREGRITCSIIPALLGAQQPESGPSGDGHGLGSELIFSRVPSSLRF
jgi:hypothetical protein